MAMLQADRPVEFADRQATTCRQMNERLAMKARRLVSTEIAFVYRPESGKPVRAEITDLCRFLAEIQTTEGAQAVTDSRTGQTMLFVPNQLLTAEQERRLFLQMNYLKYRANALRSRLNPANPSRSRVEEIEALLSDVKRIRDCLCEYNLRLVLAIARKLSNSQTQFEEFVSDGSPILLRCVDLFDASRGYRFSTYVTHAVQRHLYRVLQNSHRRRQKLSTTESEILAAVAESESNQDAEIDHAALFQSIWQAGRSELDEREQTIVIRRFGLHDGNAQSLRQIAEGLGISKERVRQVQVRAMERLQNVARSLNLNPIFD